MIAGVDFDTFTIDVALVDEVDAGVISLESFRFRGKTEGAGGDEVAKFLAMQRIPHLAGRMPFRPSVVFIEHGFAPPGQMRQLFALGRVQGLIVATFLSLGAAVNEMPPAEWKIAVGGLGMGNATKAAVHVELESLYPGAAELTENMRDALCIAYTGALLNRRAASA